jgi:hypothetical protein
MSRLRVDLSTATVAESCAQVVHCGYKKPQELVSIELDDVDLDLASKPEALVMEQCRVRAVLLSREGAHSPCGEG